MKIVTWNVNSLPRRLPAVLRWLRQHRPEVLCLQETKVTDEKFPRAQLEEAGYQVHFRGQKAYNGVAILSTANIAPVTVQLPAMAGAAPQARLVAADTHDTLVMSVYVPNGMAVGSSKWAYKLFWLQALAASLHRDMDPTAPVALCGDFNVAPHDRDAANPSRWADTVLCHPQARAALAAVMGWGLTDSLHKLHPAGGTYTWWDYRGQGFAANDGVRIDHLLVTQPLAERLQQAQVDVEARAGPEPSDHAPTWARFGS